MTQSSNQFTAMQLLTRMFEVEMRFIQSPSEDLDRLAEAFHPEVIIHEPASLPYSGDWKGLEGTGALFQRMREVWSDMRVENLEGVRTDDTVFMTCTLQMTSRVSGTTLRQPFAEVLRFKNELLIEGTPFYFDTAEIISALK